jgi:hypothetical protein
LPPPPNTSVSMNLTREQAGALIAKIGPMQGYLFRLLRRMETVGFLQADPLYRLVRDAEVELHRMSVELRYRSCGSGGPPRPKKADWFATERAVNSL